MADRKPKKWRAWDSSSGCIEVVEKRGRRVLVIRANGYVHAGSIACELTDTGNGYIARFPPTSSVEQDQYVCLDYSQARSLALALSPHASELGFASERAAQTTGGTP